MSAKSFENELARALARPDIEELRRKLADHHAYSTSAAPSDDDWTDECGEVLEAGHDDPDLALALIAIAANTYDEPRYLGLLGAGPLEDALGEIRPEILKRVIDESRRSLRFRWILSGVWLHAIHPENVEQVREAVGEFSMDLDVPLPARPHP